MIWTKPKQRHYKPVKSYKVPKFGIDHYIPVSHRVQLQVPKLPTIPEIPELDSILNDHVCVESDPTCGPRILSTHVNR